MFDPQAQAPAEPQPEATSVDAGDGHHRASRVEPLSPRRYKLEMTWLELHHRQPYARGGEHTVDGMEVRCRPHNQHQANLDFGKTFMDRKRQASQAREQLAPYDLCA